MVNVVGVWLYNDPRYMIAGNPTAYYGPIWTVVYTLLGIGLPLIVVLFYQRSKRAFIAWVN